MTFIFTKKSVCGIRGGKSMKLKAYLNRLLREESKSMRGVRLVIKIILVLLVLSVYALLNTLVLESIPDRALSLIHISEPTRPY